MSELLEGEYELGGLVLGSARDYDVIVIDAEHGNPVWTHNDNDVSGSEYRSFGVSTEHGPTWTFTFLISTDDGPSARAVLAQLRAAWTARKAARTPGTVQRLRYRTAGQTRRLYGRPQGFAPADWSGIDQGIITATAQFVTDSPYYYEDTDHNTSLTIFAAPAAGFVFPVTFPFTTTPGGARQGVVDVGGTVETPARITFYGPISNPKLEGNGWSVGLDTTIAGDKWVTIDSRARTVLHADGYSLGGKLTRGTWLKDVRLQPGVEDIAFTGVDSTGTARAVIEWNDAHDSL